MNNDLEAAIRLRATEAMLLSARMLEHRLDLAAKPHFQTGDMQNAIDVEYKEGELSIQASCDVPYASFVDRGTKPHDIWPKKPGGLLRWKTVTGETVFARHVSHPGYAGSQWWSNTVKAWGTDMLPDAWDRVKL